MGKRMIARVDSNQAEITAALRKQGATVQHLHTIGRGCPDLLVGWRGDNYLLELKDGSKTRSARALTPDELAWHETWKGSVFVVGSAVEALALLGMTGPYAQLELAGEA